MAGSSNIDQNLQRSIKIRYISVLVGLVVVVVAIFYKVFVINTVHGERLLAKQYQVTHRVSKEIRERGQVFDRFGFGLALNMPRAELWVDQRSVVWSDDDIIKFSNILNADIDVVKGWFKTHQHTYRKYTTADWATYQILKQSKFKGLRLETHFKRYYPLADAAAHLIGKVNADGKGLMGLEFTFNQYLSGQSQSSVNRQDRYGRVMQSTMHNNFNESNLETTIDHRIQHYAYEALSEMVDKSEANSGAVIVLGRNGDIHAMVNYPSYDPNMPIKEIDHKLKNKSYIDMFEPGSIIKPIALAALLSNKLPDDKKFYTGNGKFKFLGHIVSDTTPSEYVVLKDILIKSSNIAMVKLAQGVLGKHLIEGLQKFALFDSSGIHLYGEPINHDYAAINRDSASYLTASYGYGIQVTLLRIAHAYLILANQGVDPGVRLIHNDRVEPRKVVEIDIAKRVVKMMQSAVMQNGTGRRARIKGVSVAGKTGTTHKQHKSGGYDQDAHIASFIGFAPVDDPQFVVAVMLDEPKGRLHYGGTSCAPLFRDVMDYALKFRNIPPQMANDKGVTNATSYN